MNSRLHIAAVVLLAFVTGCAGTTTATNTDTMQSAPAATDAPLAGQSHGHRHRRRHRHAGDAYANASTGATTDTAVAPSGNGAWPCDDTKFTQIQAEFASGALEGDQAVDVCGPVTRVLAARTTRSGLHGYYYVQVAANDTIEIVSDLGEMNAPQWPWVKVGDYSYVQGRYYFDSATSQGIDWTHHGASASWPNPGYVVVNGTQYR
jgi:hypothetical protein